VTTPVDPRLTAVAGWEIGALAGAVGLLDDVADSLSTWRFRLEAVGRALESAEVWSGPAAIVAGATILRISAAATAVAAAFEQSLGACRRMVGEAGSATALAGAALSRSPTDPAAGALADEALAHAARAVAAADVAGEVLAGLGVHDAFTPARFGDLALRVAAVPRPDVPEGADAAAHAAWWVALSAPVQRAAIRRQPAVVGALDGVPAWARDRANRLLLTHALAAAEPSATARAVAAEIARQERAGRDVQLQLFDEPGERVVLALGDLDIATSIALLVPGIATTPDDDLDDVIEDVRGVLDAVAVPSEAAVLTGVAWLGYRPPRGLGILRRAAAERAGPALDAALDGQAAARSVSRRPAPRTTVVAHSYGTVVVDEAADAPGRMAADALVLLGSPGMERDRTPAEEVGEVHQAASVADPVSWAGWFGTSTWSRRYGATELPTEAGTGHSDYFDPGRPTLAAIAAVVAGPPPPR
jgi:hypothetical protein